MNKLLEQVFERSVEILKEDIRCLGGWHFGSIGRKQQDEFSDVDPVFLINEKDFDAFDREIFQLFGVISENCILIWPEEFNSDALKNYAILIKGSDGSIVQYDFTIMNKSRIQDPFCKIWYQGCNEENIIFDRNGDIGRILKANMDDDCIQIDILHQIKKYWLFCYLTVKHFKRKDLFKLQNVMQDLFHIHSNLLLSVYKKESWGGWPSLIKNNIPPEKQSRLLKYFCTSDLFNIKENLVAVMESFSNDIKEICRAKNLEYDSFLEQTIKNYIFENFGS